MRVTANYGLDPRLGKYYRSLCNTCGYKAGEFETFLSTCSRCGSNQITRGVLDRIQDIADYDKEHHPLHRAPYYHQVPLAFIPGIGKKQREKLLTAFGVEMNVMHYTPEPELLKIVGEKSAANIIKARNGNFKISAGAGGCYGRVIEF